MRTFLSGNHSFMLGRYKRDVRKKQVSRSSIFPLRLNVYPVTTERHLHSHIEVQYSSVQAVKPLLALTCDQETLNCDLNLPMSSEVDLDNLQLRSMNKRQTYHFSFERLHTMRLSHLPWSITFTRCSLRCRIMAILILSTFQCPVSPASHTYASLSQTLSACSLFLASMISSSSSRCRSASTMSSWSKAKPPS